MPGSSLIKIKTEFVGRLSKKRMSDGAHKTEAKISPTENMTGLFQLGGGLGEGTRDT